MKASTREMYTAFLSFLGRLLTAFALLGGLGVLATTPSLIATGWIRVAAGFVIALAALCAGFANAAVAAHDIVDASPRWHGSKHAEATMWGVLALATGCAIFLVTHAIKLRIHAGP